ncbi:riboflavin synthase [Salipaludibacillus agaradhaerens]|uniref:riboflavin synthase n=1 Tax=Salipaludibacillus agaradhaerens TaxID=76935 RepID=UPI002151F7B4|nr:riboflavin synthase [Salipaludibacillus agaradhaerens]MCR6106509.1 riboflavin synthase [Salipaludibacillus agaradhaerens]MCR6118542.1 riboflavin synthase [Salipaludibacillus agaradhaerens]UJW57636.1 riboflavin synthase [Bacillus sp. A116_S68]
MFTGIVEEKGKIHNIRQTGDAIVMTIEASKILTDVKEGDSIAVNGVCLTVTRFNDKLFTVDLMPETVRNTSLKDLKVTSSVNLERAMAANGRFGGHFVSGHVDGMGTIITKRPEHNAVYYDIKMSPELRKYMMMKGSICVDGTSLTIFGLSDNSVTVSLIPHTLEETVLGEKGSGDNVNIECDMLAKYIEGLLANRIQTVESTRSKITDNFLKEHGFNL